LYTRYTITHSNKHIEHSPHRFANQAKDDDLAVAKVDIEPKVENQSLESIQRQFTYPDLQRITNNFERIIGKGGFGKVYHGFIDGYQVAVKMLSQTSGQGYQQFQAEASKYNLKFLSSYI
jgi:hypothetical protein